MKKRRAKKYSHPRICADYIMSFYRYDDSSKMHWFTRQTSEVTRVTCPHLSLATRATYTLYFLTDYERECGQEGKMERTICSAGWFYFIVFYCGAALWHVQFRYSIFIGPIIYRVSMILARCSLRCVHDRDRRE